MFYVLYLYKRKKRRGAVKTTPPKNGFFFG